MLDPPLFLRYREAGSLDPYISCIVSVDNIVVSGNTFGALRLHKPSVSLLLHTHHGSITAIRATKCRNPHLSDYIYLICGTSFGCIYIHLVKVNNAISSAVMYKFRVESPIVGITLHPKYDMSNIKGYCERRTYDIHDHMKLVDEVDWGKIERYNDFRNSFIFATKKGMIYLLRKCRYKNSDDIVVTVLSHFNTLCRDICLSWNYDLVAWCDYYGVQIFSVIDQIPIAFLSYEIPVYPRDLNINRLAINRPRTLSQYMVSDDLYVSSDDSSSISSQEYTENDEADVGINKDMLNEVVKTHFVSDKYMEVDYTNFPFQAASLCWLSKNDLLVGYHNVVQCVSFTSLRFRGYGENRNVLLKGEFDLLDTTHTQKALGGTLSHAQSFNIGAFVKPRSSSLRAYLAYTIEMPENATVLFLSSHGLDNRFSILYSLNRVDSQTNFKMEQKRFHKKDGRFTVDLYCSPDKESLIFETFDNCTYYRKINESFAQCVRSGSKNKIEMKHLTHVVCDIDNDECKILWKQQLSIYSVLCLDYRNFQHCLKPFDYIPVQKLSSRFTDYCNRAASPYIMFHAKGSGIYLSPYSILCYNSSKGSGSFGTIYIANMGKMVSVEPCDLKGHMDQLMEHGMFSKAIQHIVYYRKMLYATEFDGYLLNIFTVGIQTLLSKSYLNIKAISRFTLLYIRCCNDLVSSDVKEFFFQKIFDHFYAFCKVNILIGYILPPDLGEYFLSLNSYKSMIKTFIDGFRGNEFLTILRIVSFWKLDEGDVRKVFCVLRQGLIEHICALKFNDLEVSSCLVDNELLAKDFSLGVISQDQRRERKEMLDEILEQCNEITLETVRFSCYTGVVKDNVASDFELLKSYLSRGSESLLHIFKRSTLSPSTIAGLLSFGTLLYNCGYYELSFIFFLHSKSPLVFEIAKRIYGANQNTQVIFRAAYFLYSIDSNEASKVFMLESSKSPKVIKTIVEILGKHEPFLWSYLQMLYTGDLLSVDLYPIYVEHLAVRNTEEIISFIKSAENTLKNDVDLIHNCIASLNNAMHKVTLSLHSKNLDSWVVMKNISEIYVAKAYLLSLSDHPSKEVVDILTFSILLGHEAYNKSDVVSSLERFSLALQRTFGGNGSNEMLYKFIKFMDGGHYGKHGLVKAAIFCGELAEVQSELFKSDLKYLKKSFMNTKGRGMVFYTDFKSTNSMKPNAVKRYSTCFLCHSIDARFFDCNKFSNIIHTLAKGIENVDLLKDPGGNKILHFFCGHVSHEYCQIKIINCAIQLKNTVETQDCDYRIKNVESVCLLCLSNS